MTPDFDECESVQCGGKLSRCINRVDEFVCVCAHGWKGGGVKTLCKGMHYFGFEPAITLFSRKRWPTAKHFNIIVTTQYASVPAIECTRPRDKVSVERYMPSMEASSSINLPSLQDIASGTSQIGRLVPSNAFERNLEVPFFDVRIQCQTGFWAPLGTAKAAACNNRTGGPYLLSGCEPVLCDGRGIIAKGNVALIGRGHGDTPLDEPSTGFILYMGSMYREISHFTTFHTKGMGFSFDPSSVSVFRFQSACAGVQVHARVSVFGRLSQGRRDVHLRANPQVRNKRDVHSCVVH